MQNYKSEFFQWLVSVKKYAEGDAKKLTAAVVMLEEYAVRHCLGGVLFEASLQQIETFMEIFLSNDVMRNANFRRGGRLWLALSFLKEFKAEVKKQPERETVTEPIPESESMLEAEPISEVGTMSATEPISEAKPIPESESMLEAEPIPESESIPEAEPIPEVGTMSATEPISEAEPTPEIEQTAEKAQRIDVDAALTATSEEKSTCSPVAVNKMRKGKAKTPEEKLARRIEREFKKCKYIGDIQISDEEYEILKGLFRLGYIRICQSFSHEVVDPLFAVALVQIGFRYYNGKFWVYVQKELGLSKLPLHHQAWIGRSFYRTLIFYGKFHVDEHEFMNNVLMHCFITKYYADDLFDFLFSYYQIDLDRDLSRNSAEMRKYLMQSMSKGENSARAYRIKRHTADAVSANEKGCRIRVGKILRFMDNALYNNIYPTNSQHRIAQLFCAWTSTSKKFDLEKKHVSGLTRKGAKQYSTPYLRFDILRERFCIVLPPQYIHLDDEEALPEISWKIIVSEKESVVDVCVDSCVTGCKTEKILDLEIDSADLMSEIRFELWKNGSERIRRFKIKSDTIRFFDNDWDALDAATYTNYLPIGQAYAFVENTATIVSSSDVVVAREKMQGYGLYTLELKKGDVLRLPDGKAKSVGRLLEEGVLTQSLVPGVYAMQDDNKSPVYSEIPSIHFRMKPLQENGTVVVVNGKRHRFDVEHCVRFDLDEDTDEKGYILNLDTYLSTDGIYELLIDVPNSRKERNFRFVLLRNFGFRFDSAAYIFQKKGRIAFPDNVEIATADANITRSGNGSGFEFDILPDKDYLSFDFRSSGSSIAIRIYLPALKWRFDDGEWNVDRPEEIWHKEFPKVIWIKHPDDEISFSMTPIILDEADGAEEEENSFSVSFSKDKQEHVFRCDTRRMPSWFGYEEAFRTLYLETAEQRIPFATIVTRCQVNSVEILEDFATGELIFKSNVSGFSDCVADILYGEELLVEKQNVSTSGIRAKVPFRSGDYKIVYYEWDEEEDDFGFADYKKFQTKVLAYQNKHDLCDKEVYLRGAEGTQATSSIFMPPRYVFKSPIRVDNLQSGSDGPNVYFGRCFLSDSELKIRIEILDAAQTYATVAFYSEEDEEYFDFLFDKEAKTLVTEEDSSLDYRQAQSRYVFLDSAEARFNIKIK